MLSIQSLNCYVGANPKSPRAKSILSIDHLDIDEGEFAAVIGPNGAGKTTFLKSLSGDIERSGQIEFHNRELTEWTALERARHIGVLPQSSQLSFSFSAAEVVGLGLTPLSLSFQQAQAEVKKYMTLTDCAHLAEQAYPMLSGGEKQRVQLARVLLQLSQAETAPLLLLDEPTSAQDLAQQHGLLTLARDLCHERDYTVIAILHDLNQVFAYCDRSLVIHNGKLTSQGKPNDCLNADTIEQYWGYRPQLLQTKDAITVVV